MANVYALGQTVWIRATFSAPDGRVTEPVSATLRVRRPDGTVVEHTYPGGTLQRVADGQLSAVVQADLAGRWLCRYTGVGTGGDRPAHQWHFDVTGGF